MAVKDSTESNSACRVAANDLQSRGFLIMNYKHTTCKPLDAIRGWLYETARSGNKNMFLTILNLK